MSKNEEHVYRVKLESVEVLVKAASMADARRSLASKITVKRLTTGELYEAMKRGELVIEHEDQQALQGLEQPSGDQPNGDKDPYLDGIASRNELADANDAER